MVGVSRQAPAKINLWLNVVGRRAPSGEKGGYHLLDSLVAFADLADTLVATPSDGLALVVDGLGAAALSGELDNLVLRAARRLANHAGVAPRAALRLTKNIPVAAGLGGGSADAAAALLVLSDLWRLALPVEELFDLAAGLGADVPMCLASRPAIASGVGERLDPAPALPACALLLVNPGTVLSTAEVFGARRGGFSSVRPVVRVWSDLAGLVEALAARGNDLIEPAVALRPVVGEVLAFLRGTAGARHVSMSGSGATCFALYADDAEARAAAAHVPAGWWHHVGGLMPG